MMGELIERGTIPHKCKPFMDKIKVQTEYMTKPYFYETTPPVGTIWRCECGILWEVRSPLHVNTIGNRWVKARLSTRFKVWNMLRNSTIGKHDE